MVDHAQGAIAVVDPFDDQAKPVKVHDIQKPQMLAAHLQVDAVEVLLPADDGRTDAFVAQGLGQCLLDFADQVAAIS